MPKISVILTSYNHAAHLRQSIESVLNQTFADFELIIWDDASTDNSWEVIQSFRDKRIRAFRNQQNRRGHYGLNQAISSKARAGFIAVNHSDDVWEPNKLARQLEVLESRPDIGAVFSWAAVINEDGTPFENESHFYHSVFEQPNRSRHEWLHHFFHNGNVLCHPSVLIRRQCYDDCGLYRANFAQSADFDMWVRLCLQHEIYVMPEKLVRFRIHQDESNASGDRPESKPHIYYDFFKILENYRAIRSPEELVKVFPEAQEYVHPQGFDADFALAMVALSSKPFIFTELFGLNLLFEILQDAERAQRVELLYGFREQDLFRKTAEHDVFSFALSQRMPQLEWKITRQAKIIQANKRLLKKAEQDNFPLSLELKVARLARIIQSKKRLLEEKEKYILEREQVILEMQKHLNHIYTSRSWRLVQAMKKIYGAIFPANTLQTRSLRWLVNRLRSVRQLLKPEPANLQPAAEQSGGSTAGALEKSASGELLIPNLPPKEWWHALDVLQHIPSKIAPLKLRVSKDNPLRVNIVFSEIRFKYFFGGYYAVMNLALKLQALGHQVRILLVDPCQFDIKEARENIRAYKGLEDFFERVEVVEVSNRARALKVNPNDCFLATSWWTAHIAHAAVKQLKRERFIYLTQEFEPLFYPGGSYYALALESYDLPHYAIYSTELLRNYARRNRIGVYRWGAQKGDIHSIAFENAVIAQPPSLEHLQARKTRKLVFYSRLEEHARRNVFELGTLALRQFIKEDYGELKDWEFDGMGSVNLGYDIQLYKRKKLNILPKMSLNDYFEKIRQYDIGLSLMLSPHPSLVPLDLAGSGVLSVTNTFGIKSSESLVKISRNIIPVRPSISSIVEGLHLAKSRIYNYEDRIQNARLNWAKNWDESYHHKFVEKLNAWVLELQRPE